MTTLNRRRPPSQAARLRGLASFFRERLAMDRRPDVYEIGAVIAELDEIQARVAAIEERPNAPAPAAGGVW